MGEAFIVRKGGVTSDETAAPTITIVSEDPTGVTFTVTNNDDNTALITHEVDDNIGAVELAAAATSSNITVALSAGTYTLSAFATVVGEVATQSTAAVEIVVIPAYEELFSTTVATATTQIDITSLSIGKDDTLRLVYTNKVPSQTFSRYSIFPNDETTATDYHTQNLAAVGSGTGAGRVNLNEYSYARLNGNNTGFADIKVSNNDRFVVQSYSSYNGTGTSASEEIGQYNFNIVGSGFTLTSITKITLLAGITNGFAVGAKVALYKVTEAA